MNSSGHVHDRMTAYLAGESDEAERRMIGEHLSSCDLCRREFESLKNLWSSLGALPEEEPGEMLRRRFYDSLNTLQAASDRRAARGWIDMLIPRRPAIQFAFAALLLVAGTAAGYLLHGRNLDGEQIGQLRGEVQTMSRLLTFSLLQQQSASERLEGVSWSTRLQHADPEITAALLQALKYDPNVNVRLAALDALSRNITQASIRRELAGALERQSSPLVQISIIDLMVQTHDKESKAALEEMLHKPGVNEEVKKRIEQGIQQLNS